LLVAMGRANEAVGEPATDSWTSRFVVSADNRRVVESLTALGNGSFGTRGLISHSTGASRPDTFVNGLYDNADVPRLLAGPVWNGLDACRPESGNQAPVEEATLDLAAGVLKSETVGETIVSSVEFVSLCRPGVVVLRISGPVDSISPGDPLREPPKQPGVTVSRSSNDPQTLTVASGAATITAAASDVVCDEDGLRTLTRIAVYTSSTTSADAEELEERCRERLGDATNVGFAALLAEHTNAWRERWKPITIDLDSQPDTERSLRFAQFHLLCASNPGDEVAIGARGLTGRAYNGHVFWDTDVFVLPALAAFAPTHARAALRYRWHRLAPAQRRAHAEGRRGARFPWESAGTGDEVTPRSGTDLHGNIIPIKTGQEEEHIVADVAWAMAAYVAWTGDQEFLRTTASEIFVETARYWQSRIEVGDDGVGHLRGVIGPDEYHETIDDNAFTNLMARWNLRHAVTTCEELGIGDQTECAAWRRSAERLLNPYDEQRGIHEQFNDFFELEPVLAGSLGQPPLPADALLGHERIQQTQIIKQADVLMLHHMIPDDMPPGSLESDLAYYLPRTAHGSSLSPAVTASLLARSGQTEAALFWFDLAARLDTDDLSHTTAGGIHLATMGGLLQAFNQGFLGVRPRHGDLVVDPRVPPKWGTITQGFIFRCTPVLLVASEGEFRLTSTDPISTVTAQGERRTGRRITARRTHNQWEYT